MTGKAKTYTYRCGQKVELDISPDQMVVRALPDQLTDSAIINAGQVSSSSTHITTRALDLDSAMDRSREIAPIHPTYSETETGAEPSRVHSMHQTMVNIITNDEIFMNIFRLRSPRRPLSATRHGGRDPQTHSSSRS